MCPTLRYFVRILVAASMLQCAKSGNVAQSELEWPCYVSCDFPGSGLKMLLGPSQVPEIEREITQTVANVLGERFPLWPFHSGDSDSDPRFELKIALRNSGFHLSVRFVSNAIGFGVWSNKPGDELLEGDSFPGPPELPKRVLHSLTQLLDDKEQIITPLLADNIPLISTINPPEAPLLRSADPADSEEGAELRAVLPLNEKRYARVGTKEFKEVYRQPNGDLVAIFSRGAGHFDRTPDGKFQGLVVILETLGQEPAKKHERELSKMSLMRVFVLLNKPLQSSPDDEVKPTQVPDE